MEHRKILELRHDEKILNNNIDSVWGWTGAAGRTRLERRAGLINDFIKLGIKSNSINILELGCGTGLFTETIDCSDGGKIISLDIYEGFVRKASNRIRNKNKKAFFLVADAETLPFLNESFDIVFGVSVLHHLNLDIALKEIRRVLKSGGKIIFSEPNMLNPQIFIQKNVGFIKKYAGDSPSETAFFPPSLKYAFNENNFKVDIYPFDFLHPNTPKAFIWLARDIGLWLERYSFLRYIAGSLLIKGEMHEGR